MSPPPPAPPPAGKDEGRRKASGFPYWLDVQTRWSDNDQYGHVNNAMYYHAADAAINDLLVSHCSLQPYRQPTDPPLADPSLDCLGLMISTSAIYFAPATFPCLLRVGLRVIKIGSSSVLFELGMFELPSPSKGRSLPFQAAQGAEGDASINPPPRLDPNALAGTLTRATHVYVDRATRRPLKPMPKPISDGLRSVYVKEWSEDSKDKPKL
ncbi:hypothetical protein BCV69DRAFT_300414 [Microstroma glucosiphilum]|uniref:Thioesterase domain-containing protein n=1 Tax=Pseudomicrostroma glucosiphilum TaxID=1684307 RepID=A0A316U575_9BASI|nr:hypothetical protein BCV69DRAFT_300414 [Pseudomicrostroma glucosiphilum]PWN19601.1 hypothetical protein BCV69DRAFT_300414 [Pseudomicrostroma glucosiphilum]